jgi:hypothetical protein
MAMTGLVIPEIANVSGLLPSTVDRMLRVLRAAGMVAMGKPGRGREHGHYSPSDLANVILGMAGPQPSDAAEAVMRLRDLKNNEGNLLGDTLEQQIAEVAANLESEQINVIEALLPSDLSMCFDAPHASMDWDADSTNRCHMPFFRQRPTEHVGYVTRSTTVNRQVIFVAGRLWLDTLRQRSSDPSSAPSGQLPLPGDAGTTNENGAPGRAPRTRLQDHDLAIPAGHTPEYRRESENAQALLGRGPGPSPNRHRKDLHHGRTTHAAAGPGG